MTQCRLTFYSLRSTYTDPTGIVVPVDLRSFTLGTAVVLTGNPLLTSAAESGGYAYFG